MASSDAAAGARIEARALRGSGWYIKGKRQAEKGLLARNARDLVALGRVRLGLKVGDDPDRWAPPVGETKRGTPLSAAAARRRRADAGRSAVLALGRGERERNGPSPRQGGREEILFYFLNSYFAQIF